MSSVANPAQSQEQQRSNLSASKEQQLKKLKEICVVNERSSDPLIKIEGLAYLVVQRPDVDKAAKFFEDYGLLVDRRVGETIYFRGTSQKSHLIVLEKGEEKVARVGFTASAKDVEKLAQAYNKPINTHPDPMGGRFVSLQDPDGLGIEVNCDLTPLDKVDIEKAQATIWNHAEHKERINEGVRHDIKPVVVGKLGHTLWLAASIRKTVHWYQDVLGMIVSDFQFLKDDPIPVVAFLRCDRGDEPTDHHTLGIGSALELGHDHSAFEMDSYEEIAIANQWMRKKKYLHGWGIGRHILGSQVFDYWRDPSLDMFEHYADGDLFDNSISPGYHFFNAHAQHQWGPDMPDEFKGVTRPWRIIKSILKRLPTDDDLTLKRIGKMIKVA